MSSHQLAPFRRPLRSCEDTGPSERRQEKQTIQRDSPGNFYRRNILPGHFATVQDAPIRLPCVVAENIVNLETTFARVSRSEDRMEHLSVSRLIALSIEGSVTDSVESQHLKNCYQ